MAAATFALNPVTLAIRPLSIPAPGKCSRMEALALADRPVHLDRWELPDNRDPRDQRDPRVRPDLQDRLAED